MLPTAGEKVHKCLLREEEAIFGIVNLPKTISVEHLFNRSLQRLGLSQQI